MTKKEAVFESEDEPEAEEEPVKKPEAKVKIDNNVMQLNPIKSSIIYCWYR